MYKSVFHKRWSGFKGGWMIHQILNAIAAYIHVKRKHTSLNLAMLIAEKCISSAILDTWIVPVLGQNQAK